MKPAPIGLGDFVRAAMVLGKAGDDLTEIASLLGAAPVLELEVATLETPAAATGSVELPQVSRGVDAPTVLPPTTTVDPSPRTPAPGAPGGNHIVVRRVDTPSRSVPDWLAVDPVPVATTPTPKPDPIEPLLEPIRTRAIVIGAVSTLAADGEVAVELLVERLAVRAPMHVLPRRLRATLRRGAWLLVDHGSSMEPFFEDAADLTARLARLLGVDSMHVRYFAGDPTTTWVTRPLVTASLELPPAGTPLVALTDLGIRTGSTARWRVVADEMRRRSSPLVAFVPYARDRWPVDLPGVVIVPWDRTARTARTRRT